MTSGNDFDFSYHSMDLPAQVVCTENLHPTIRYHTYTTDEITDLVLRAGDDWVITHSWNDTLWRVTSHSVSFRADTDASPDHQARAWHALSATIARVAEARAIASDSIGVPDSTQQGASGHLSASPMTRSLFVASTEPA